MIISAHQPAYLPWLGYFEKILRSDVFVFLDAVQFEKNSFTNRNRIKTARGPIWLTVPVKIKGHTAATMRETEIDNTQNWKKKHLQALKLNYAKAPRFHDCFPKIAALYDRQHALLADLCYEHLEFWLAELGIGTTLVRQSTLPVRAAKSELILKLCRHFGATRYLAGALGKAYLDEPAFAAAGIAVEYQDYRHPAYPQLYGPFVPNMGIVDMWMNTSDVTHITGGL